MQPNHGPRWLSSPVARTIELIGAAIAIFAFVTGISSLRGILAAPRVPIAPTRTLTVTSPGTSLTATPSFPPQSSGSNGPKSPVEFIRSYYQLVSEGKYEDSFSLLSQDFRNRNHGPTDGGYQGYVDWWNSVRSVELLSFYTEFSDTHSAKVETAIHYVLKNGDDYQDTVFFQLTRSSAESTWLIDATPTEWGH